MVRVHRNVLDQTTPPVNAVFVDTPAGFEVNADEITAKAIDYFQQHFGIALAVASFRSKLQATAQGVQAALFELQHANFIFAGPGSPTFAIRNWRGSPIWDTIVARWAAGAHLVFASAAAIATGCCSLPVYEIYKAGHDVDWVEGLDLFGTMGLQLAVIPHWNNTEGGKYDTRYCFMGQDRLLTLEEQLAPNTVVLGVDEHTAITFYPVKRMAAVSGLGQVTIRYKSSTWEYPSGSTISFDQMSAVGLLSSNAVLSSTRLPSPEENPATSSIAEAVPNIQVRQTSVYLDQLARAMEESGEESAQRELIGHAHETMHELAQTLNLSNPQGLERDITPLVELLISLRSQLRAQKQFALADQIRIGLGDTGIVLEDTAQGTHWKKR